MQTDFRGNGGGRYTEGHIRATDTYYRDLVKRLPAVVYVGSVEPAGVLYISPRIEELLGYTPEEWLADRDLWLKVLHPEDRERVLAEGMSTNEEGRPFRAEYRLISRDGREVWVRDEAVPVLDEESRPNGLWRGVMLDVTEHKRSEQALEKSEERYRLVARATGEAIWDNDLLTGKQEWSGATEALFGYPPNRSEDAVWWEERIHPEDRERVLSSLRTLYNDGGEAWSCEYRFRRADGDYAVVVDRGYVVRNKESRAVRMVGSMADVTERREWERRLIESEERFRSTFEAAAVGMAHVAPDGRWIRINDKLVEISGYGREELLDMSYQDMSVPEEEGSQERVERLLEGGDESYTVERRYIRKDGRRVWVNVSVSPVQKSSGELDYFACVVEDITERKIVELVPDPLTLREMKILCKVVEGQTNPQIARNLSYSLGTVKLELKHISAKLAVKNRKLAVVRAVEIGLVPPPRS